MPSSRAASLHESAAELLQRAFLVELAAVVTLLVALHAGTIALSAVLDPYFLDSDTSLLLVRSVLVLAGIAALVASYASWRGYSLPMSVPDRTDGEASSAPTNSASSTATPCS